MVMTMATKKETISTEEARWRAEDDARTLRRAAEVMGDKGRHTAAKKHISGEISNMQKVLGAGSPPDRSKVSRVPPVKNKPDESRSKPAMGRLAPPKAKAK